MYHFFGHTLAFMARYMTAIDIGQTGYVYKFVQLVYCIFGVLR
jgi:hypothetical protein